MEVGPILDPVAVHLPALFFRQFAFCVAEIFLLASALIFLFGFACLPTKASIAPVIPANFFAKLLCSFFNACRMFMSPPRTFYIRMNSILLDDLPQKYLCCFFSERHMQPQTIGCIHDGLDGRFHDFAARLFDKDAVSDSVFGNGCGILFHAMPGIRLATLRLTAEEFKF